MKNAKHTPGPWTAHPPHGGNADADGDEYKWVIRAPHKHAISFQLCKLSSSNTPELEHDARLISAAPCLLAVAKKIKAHGTVSASWIDELDAAINKATGEIA